MTKLLASLLLLFFGGVQSLTLSRRSAVGGAFGGAALATIGAALPSNAVVTKEQRAAIKALYNEDVPEGTSDAEFRARYAGGSAFSQDRQDVASSLEAKMGISSPQSSERLTKVSAAEQRDITKKRELGQLKAPKPKPTPRNRLSKN
mmetsp:Transcript_16169/g.48238  ORF Transcript_16169/g.48238 Transcript_16169/m.48238 type:complete len:147 (-) Transcript_16169:18-458(-)